MLDLYNLPPSFVGDVQVFGANTNSATAVFTTWTKPRGVSMISILAIGAGGNGGNGAVGAASTAAGGGGGGSGAQAHLTIPAILFPDLLYISVGAGGTTSYTVVSLYPSTTSNHQVLFVAAGGNGGNASGATAGAAGANATAPTITLNPLAGLGVFTFLAGQAGIIGATTGAGGALTLPTNGLYVTGGTGGAGLGNAASTGSAGGSFTVNGRFPPQPGGIAAGSQTTPAGNGSNGFNGVITGLLYNYGGTGGGSTGGAATGGGLVAGKGGAGGIGCGGGGGGGGFTGSTQGTGGAGGPGQVTIIAW